MKINVKRNSIWIPDWEDNKKLPEKEQIRFHHRYLTLDERDEFIYIESATVEQVQLEESGNRKFIQDKKGIAQRITTKIENLVMVDENGKEEKLDTIDKFYSAPDAFSELKVFYEAYCISLSARVDSKNSGAPSGAT